MRIIPSICDPETPSSEKKVFLKFKDLNYIKKAIDT